MKDRAVGGRGVVFADVRTEQRLVAEGKRWKVQRIRGIRILERTSISYMSNWASTCSRSTSMYSFLQPESLPLRPTRQRYYVIGVCARCGLARRPKVVPRILIPGQRV